MCSFMDSGVFHVNIHACGVHVNTSACRGPQCFTSTWLAAISHCEFQYVGNKTEKGDMFTKDHNWSLRLFKGPGGKADAKSYIFPSLCNWYKFSVITFSFLFYQLIEAQNHFHIFYLIFSSMGWMWARVGTIVKLFIDPVSVSSKCCSLDSCCVMAI